MKHIITLHNKPQTSGKQSTPDGAITGNGDLAVILGSAPDGLRLYLAKSDLWYGAEGVEESGMKPLGYIDIAVDPALYANYHAEVDMDRGEVRCAFVKAEQECRLTVTVCKTENAVIIRSAGNAVISPVLKVYEGETSGRKGAYDKDGGRFIWRSFDGNECAYETHIYAGLKPIDPNTFYCFAATNHDGDKPQETVEQTVLAADEARVERLLAEHDKAWAEFWSRSSFEISDEDFELGWYAAQYFLAVCAGNKKFPPGIFGNFITVENPSWHNDYHLNYNFQAPFYAACSSNHVELTDCYMAPLEEFYEKGADFAKRWGCGGVLFPVGIAPKGLCTELDKKNKRWFERLFLGQKSNGIHPTNIPIFRWKATRDLDYAREHAYPYLKKALAFFEDYATEEDGRFSVGRDAAHEVPYYKEDFDPKKYKRYINDKNNTVTLGALRLGLAAAIDMAEALGVDEDKQKQWRDMLDRLSPFATCIRFGRRVYRYTEKGQRWNGNGDVGLQHVYPFGCVGLSSPKEELKIARATYKMKERVCFKDDNAVSSFFTMGARLGVDPKLLTKKLRELNQSNRQENFLYLFGGGCLEDCPIPANLFNEMALQSHQGLLRLFPCWDNSLDAKFENLRADGAFLVSSEIKNGVIGPTKIVSEVGGPAHILMPKDGLTVTHQGKTEHIDGNRVNLETKPGDVIVIE